MLRWLRRPGPAPTLGQLAEALGGRLVACPPSLPLDSLGPIDSPDPVSLAPLWHERAVADVAASAARVLLADAAFAARAADSASARGLGMWIHPRPRRALAGVLERLYESRDPWAGVPPGTAVHPEASVHPAASLGPGALVGPGSTVGEGASIGPGAVVLHDVRIGARVSIGPGCVVGADGFGLDATHGDLAPLPLPHVGSVELGDDVSLGALVVVARGTLGPTAIGAGTRIDAHVQVGHNVRIGRGCVICAQVGIGGSTRIGDGVWIGGQAGIADHCRIGARAKLAAQSGVIGDVPADAVFGGTPAVPHATWMRGAAALARLARGGKR
ncbi:MAG: UDP-3-O-(3-hydroxymyristoyl)glucosamine N-acyltransferase [Deltaproteobacteria bacterium]|nr:UDP-3-O-(3-hydroxymyristoyl)glucosamine N-acyltransferase [Deltaproteobacteria bacterium]